MLRRERLIISGFLALTATVLTGCPGDPGDEGVQCASGLICPSGSQCAANQDVCIDDSCGDGVVDSAAGEECDDGNILDGDGCASACTREAFCGDGTVDAGEECDDGNTADNDGCSSDCVVVPYCGDNNVDPGEECDDGNLTPGDGCSATCEIEQFVCGNGVLEAGEECDDGNNDNGDGCSSDCRDENNACPAPVDRNYQYTYVIDSMLVPQSVAEADMLALDIDFQDPPRADNLLGTMMAQFGQQFGVDHHILQQGAINRGDTIMLASLQTIDQVNTLCATVGIYLGENPSDPPCTGPGGTVCGNHLGGTTSFDVAADSPADPTMDGALLASGFTMSTIDTPGNVAIELQLSNSAPPTRLDLVGVRVQFDTVFAVGVQSGILGGAMLEADAQSQFVPGLHNAVVETIAADCTGGSPCCAPGSSGESMVDLFDTDSDCQVTLDEFRDSALIGALLAPDVDLFDASGDFNPGVDGVNDSLSIGVGVTAVGGQFSIP